MTEGEVCLDYAKMAETQRQTQLGHALAAKKVLLKRKRDSGFQDEGRLAIIGAEFRIHMGNVGIMMQKLLQRMIRATFADLVQQDEVVVVYSGLWSFAHRLPWDAREAPKKLLDTMIDVLGPDRTLVFPTYTFSYCRTRQFDIVRSPAETGILAQVAVEHPCFVRSARPIYSYAAIGPKAQEICGLPATTSWGDDGPMAWMYDNDVRFVVLGVPWHLSCSYIHRSEEILKVPYRFFKKFAGTMSRDGTEVGPVSETMYVRSARVEPLFDYAPASKAISRQPNFRLSREANFPAQSARGRDIMDCSLDLLRKDGFVFVKNRDEVAAWMADGKDDELAAMSANERA